MRSAASPIWPIISRNCAKSGLMLTRIVGTNRLMKLRREDLDARFPGLLDAVIRSAGRDAERLRIADGGTD